MLRVALASELLRYRAATRALTGMGDGFKRHGCKTKLQNNVGDAVKWAAITAA
jgi:hypothetical protein